MEITICHRRDDPKAELNYEKAKPWDTATDAVATRSWKGTVAGPSLLTHRIQEREGAAFFDPITAGKGWGNDRTVMVSAAEKGVEVIGNL